MKLISVTNGRKASLKSICLTLAVSNRRDAQRIPVLPNEVLNKNSCKLRQNSGENNTNRVKISNRLINMAKLRMTLAVELRLMRVRRLMRVLRLKNCAVTSFISIQNHYILI